MKKAFFLLGCFALMFAIFSGCKRDGAQSDPLKKQAEDHYTKARRLFLSCNPDQYPEAFKEFQLALKSYDEYPEALAGLAETASMWRGFNISEKEFGESYQAAQRAVRLNPDLAAGYRAMADLYRHKREYDRALRTIEKALALEPNNPENLYVKGSSLLDSSPEQAYEILFKARQLNQDLPKVTFNLASAAQKLKKYDEAIELLKRYQFMIPSDPAGYTSMGMVVISKLENETDAKLKKDIYAQAMEAFKLSQARADVNNKPWHTPWVMYNLKTMSRIEFENDNYDPALEYIKKAEAINDRDPEIYLVEGILYKLKGDKAKAKEALQKGATLKPDDEQIQEELKGL